MFVLDMCSGLTHTRSLVSIGSVPPKAMPMDGHCVKSFGHSSAADGCCYLLNSELGPLGCSKEHQDLQTPKDGQAGGQSFPYWQRVFAQAQVLVQAMGPWHSYPLREKRSDQQRRLARCTD